MNASPFWHPDNWADKALFLRQRAKFLRKTRAYFENEGFLEAETPILQHSPGNETHLHAFATKAMTPQGEEYPLMLRTLTEFTLKKTYRCRGDASF